MHFFTSFPNRQFFVNLKSYEVTLRDIVVDHKITFVECTVLDSKNLSRHHSDDVYGDRRMESENAVFIKVPALHKFHK